MSDNLSKRLAGWIFPVSGALVLLIFALFLYAAMNGEIDF